MYAGIQMIGIIEIFYFIFVVLVAAALGQRILKLIGLKIPNLERFIFSLPLGLALLAYIAFLLGAIGLLFKSIFISILLLLFIILIKDIKNLIIILFNFIKNVNLKKITKEYKLGFNFFTILLLFLSLFIVLNFIISFSPPWNHDALSYHLAIPKVYIENHKIISMPYNFLSNFPSLIDMISMVGLLLHSAKLSHLFAYALSVILVLAIYSFCKKFFNVKIAILASLIFYSFPMVIEYVSTALIDIQLALFIFLSIYGLFMYFHSKKNSWFFLSAIFMGLSVSSKLLSIFLFVGIFILLVYNLFLMLVKKEINFRNLFFKILIFCLIVFVITTPWLIKNFLHTNNPVWPIFNSFFNGKYMDEEHREYQKNELLGRELSIVNYIRLPWDLHVQIVQWKNELDWRKGRNISEGEHLGPYLIFLPFYFFLRKKSKILNAFFFLIFIYVTLWFFVANGGRYLLYVAPLLAVIVAYIIIELFKYRILSKVLKILLIFTFSFNLLIWFGGNTQDLVVALGFESEESFYERQSPVYKPSKFINSNLPKNSKILLFREVKGFFLERDYVWSNPITQVYVNYSKFKNENDYYEELKKLGITHILVNNGSFAKFRGFTVLEEYFYLNEKSINLTNKLLDKYTTNIYNKDNWLVNEIK